VLAELAWPDAERRWPGTRVVAGGTTAWAAAGLPLEEGVPHPTTATDDVWYKPYDAEDATVARRHMEEYLAWEVALLAQVDRDELVAFRTFPAG
jgi:3-mercaptopyruvate sulfurtransferase SseA